MSQVLDRIRAHAAYLRVLLRLDERGVGETAIYRTLYEKGGRAYAASILRTGLQPLSAQLQMAADMGDPSTAILSGHAVTLEEICVFLGLDEVELEDVHWTIHLFDSAGKYQGPEE